MQSIILLHLREHVQQVFRRASFRPHFEHQWCEQVSARLSYINLDSSDDADFDVGDVFNDALDIPARDLVHSVGELCHGLFSLLNLLKVRLERLANIHKLVVEGIGTLWYSDDLFLIIHWLPLVCFQPSIGADGRTAS